jgi:hypothetical protein
LCRYYLGYKALKQRIRYYCERVRSETPTEDECHEIVKTFSDLLDFQVQTPASLSLSLSLTHTLKLHTNSDFKHHKAGTTTISISISPPAPTPVSAIQAQLNFVFKSKGLP